MLSESLKSISNNVIKEKQRLKEEEIDTANKAKRLHDQRLLRENNKWVRNNIDNIYNMLTEIAKLGLTSIIIQHDADECPSWRLEMVKYDSDIMKKIKEMDKCLPPSNFKPYFDYKPVKLLIKKLKDEGIDVKIGTTSGQKTTYDADGNCRADGAYYTIYNITLRWS